MITEQISDDELDCWRVLLLQESEARKTRMVRADTVRSLIARIDAAENRVCRWTYCGDIFGNYPKYDASCGEHIVGLATPYCPYCGGRVVVDEEDEE